VIILASRVFAAMNTRGLMELVVTNVGRDLGVIPDSVFCMLTIMALATTFITTPLLLIFMVLPVLGAKPSSPTRMPSAAT
jgi:hypothetical protein